MTLKELYDICLHAAKGTVPAVFANQEVDVNAAAVDGLREYSDTYNKFMKNRYDIYEILIKIADEIVPNKVIATIGSFAEVQTVGLGQKAIFKRRVGKMRAKKFLTQVGINGVYDTFRLDTTTFEISGHAVGGGVTVDYDRVLDGAESLAEVMEILNEGLTDSIYYEVTKALHAAINASAMKSTNKYTQNTFDADKMLKMINVVKAYGTGVTIFAPPEFVGAMGPDAIVPAIANTAQGIYHPQDIDAIHNTGYITIFRGTPIVQIPNSFIDENNNSTWIDPQLAYILPTGGEKVVKVVIEGPTQIHDYVNRDGSIELYAHRKIGAAIFTYHNWAIYQNTGITQTYANPYGY